MSHRQFVRPSPEPRAGASDPRGTLESPDGIDRDLDEGDATESPIATASVPARGAE